MRRQATIVVEIHQFCIFVVKQVIDFRNAGRLLIFELTIIDFRNDKQVIELYTGRSADFSLHLPRRTRRNTHLHRSFQ